MQSPKIPAQLVPTVEARIAQLNARGEALGLEPVTYTVTRIMDEHVSKVWRDTAIFDFNTDALRLPGWALAATVNHAVEGNIVARTPWFEGELPASLNTDAPTCDHCRTTRPRLDTFYLVNEDGRTARVGRQCLADFLGHDTAQIVISVLVAWKALFAEMGDEDGFGGSYGGGTPYIRVEDYLATTSGMIRMDGWLSRGAARNQGSMSTADTTWSFMLGNRELIKEFDRRGFEVTDQDRDTAARAMALLKTLDITRGDDYERNLAATVAREFIDEKTYALAASAISYLHRHEEREIKMRERNAQAAADSDHIGTVGERIERWFTVTARKDLESDWGSKTLVKLVDDDGNRAAWFGTSNDAYYRNAGDRVLLRGTVKGHDEWQGIKETKLSRCQVKEVAEKATA